MVINPLYLLGPFVAELLNTSDIRVIDRVILERHFQFFYANARIRHEGQCCMLISIKFSDIDVDEPHVGVLEGCF